MLLAAEYLLYLTLQHRCHLYGAAYR